MTGSTLRLRRLLGPDGRRTIIIPLDHGFSLGPVEGLSDIGALVGAVERGGATAVVCHRGLVPEVRHASPRNLGVMLHVSASTALAPDTNAKVAVASVEDALRLGSDGLSIHVNLGAATETAMLQEAGALAGACEQWGLPLLAMVYARGPSIKDPFGVEVLAHAARVGYELGADLVKVPYTGDPESFREVVAGCPRPVLIAGGPKLGSVTELLEAVHGAMEAGAAGVSIGRNVFQSPDPAAVTRAIARIVFEGTSVEDAGRGLPSRARAKAEPRAGSPARRPGRTRDTGAH